jgi:hypothetical protein
MWKATSRCRRSTRFGRVLNCDAGSEHFWNRRQLRGALIDGRYITAQEFDQDLAHLDDPDFMTPSPIMGTAQLRTVRLSPTRKYQQLESFRVNP